MTRSFQGVPLPEQFTECIVQKVQTIIDRAAKSLERTTAWEEIQTILQDNNLALFVQLPCDIVGVHQENRSKFGVGGTEAQKHGKDVFI